MPDGPEPDDPAGTRHRAGMPVAGIDDQAVSAWLERNVEGAAPPFVFEPIPGGNSNLTYRVRGEGEREFALRRPPLGKILESAHDMAREYRVISALQGSGVRCRPHWGCAPTRA